MGDVDPRLVNVDSSLYRVAARAVIIKDGKLLLVRENDDDYSSVPGGGIDYGETPMQALKRELQEETGLEPGEYDVNEQPVLIAQALKKGIPRLNIYYQVTLTTGEIRKAKEVEFFEWYDAGDVVKNYDQSVSEDARFIVKNLMS